MRIERMPIYNCQQLKLLDNDEIVEGYLDGLNNEPEPGDNRSVSYWHGWRNGMVDGSHRRIDSNQISLARDVVRNLKRS